MRIKHKFSFRVDDNTNNILDILDNAKIKYKLGKSIPMLTFEVFEDNSIWSDIESFTCEHSKSSIIEKVYSKKEFSDAEWFRIRSKWRVDYPQPEDAYKEVTYDVGDYCDVCGNGLIQKSNFKLNKTPNWGKKNFLMLNWVEDEIFTTSECYKALENADLKGVEFLPVLNAKTNNVLENIKQIKVVTNINQNMVLNEGAITKENLCDVCNNKKYVLNGYHQITYKRGILPDNLDIVKTAENFGDGLVCMKLILISKEFYSHLVETKKDKDLIIEPVLLVD